MMIKRRKTRTVRIGRVKIGSGHPVAVQSMVKVHARDIEASLRQIRDLELAGCEIVRLAVEDDRDALAFKALKRRTKLPLVADIHFDYRMALAAIDAGADKIRLNPGNIYKPREVREVIRAAKKAAIPIRIGANSGSLKIRSRDTAAALVKSVMDYLDIFKKEGFHDLVISVKGSHLLDTVTAYERMARACDYPLHLGVTATGLPLVGVVKSSLCIGMLLFKGIGDTIRVSLLEAPQQEVLVARLLLNSLEIRKFGPELVCCPTCGRCEVDLAKKAERFETFLRDLDPKEKDRLKGRRIALMGCIVNGPGEAREAALGIAFSKHKSVLFKRGKIYGSAGLERGEEDLFAALKDDLRRKRTR